jgi:flagellar motility protein MotE (MotC chaperone)
MFFIVLPIIGFTNKEDPKKTFEKRVKAEVERQVNMIKKKSIAQLTTELLEKERNLNAQENQLKLREEQVSLGEKSLIKRIEDFEQRKTKIFGCLDEHAKGEQLRVSQMVKVVSNMKPQKAADLLSEQDSAISIKILEKIDPVKASKIFNLMKKEVSARLQKQYLNMQE